MKTMRACLMMAALGAVSAGALARAGDDTLASRLIPLIEAHKGKVAVAVKNLETGESFAYHDDVLMPTASLIKFPVMIEAYRQAEAKETDLGKTITLTKADKVPGSGILTTHFSDGVTMPLRDAIHLMIVYSDNTATNLVVDQIGIKSTADTMETMGYPEHQASFQGVSSRFVGLPRAEQTVWPGQHDGR